MFQKTIKTKYFVYHPRQFGIATLMRVGFRFKGWQLVLHHFWPHDQIESHDHPWAFRTFVLWGAYVDKSLSFMGEEIIDKLHMGSTRKRAARHAHRTSCTCHTWTLVLMHPKERNWCKGTPETWVCEGEVQDFDEKKGMVKV